MRTQVMPERAVGGAWLEHDSSQGGSEKTLLKAFPFTIGRSESADLHIDSGQVSREHAVITRQGKTYRVKDLGSTNGTLLNGQRIEESPLSDGDILVIAEVELTFYSGAAASSQAVTRVIGPPQGSAERDATWETVLAVRRVHEIVARRAMRILFQPITEVATDKLFGYEALAGSGAEGAVYPRCQQLAALAECAVTDRMGRLFRRIAVEEAQGLPHRGRLFLAVTEEEVGRRGLYSSLVQLRDRLTDGNKLVVEIPDGAVSDAPAFRDAVTSFKEAGIEVAYDGCASGQAEILERKLIVPDFLKLVPSLVHSIQQSADRQRQVQLMVQACHDVGCEVIATGINEEDDLRVCRELGCKLAQGELLGLPESTFALHHSSRGPSPARTPGH